MAMTACAAKFCDQFDLFVAEWANFGAIDHKCTDKVIILAHRDCNSDRAPPILPAGPRIRLCQFVGCLDEFFRLGQAIEGGSYVRLE